MTTADEGTTTPDIVFITRNLSPAETAAASAVIGSMLEEESAVLRAVAPGAGRSAWQLSQRALRTGITPGPGRWRSFSG